MTIFKKETTYINITTGDNVWIERQERLDVCLCKNEGERRDKHLVRIDDFLSTRIII